MTYILMMKNTDQYGQQWERKRFIGNDIVVIVFYEGKKPLDPNIFVSNFNHVFALVVPEERNGVMHYAYVSRLIAPYRRAAVLTLSYLLFPLSFSLCDHCRLYMAYKVGVAESKPPLPEDAVWERGPEFREFLLTKRTPPPFISSHHTLLLSRALCRPRRGENHWGSANSGVGPQ
jgi:hypothetical protein